jgi:predicted dehydrogenase
MNDPSLRPLDCEIKKPDAYKDYRKILERDDIDAVMIATPDHWHTKIAVEAMYAGKDVYCEKPLTLTIDEGKLIEKVVKETGRSFRSARCSGPKAINASCRQSRWSTPDGSAP